MIILMRVNNHLLVHLVLVVLLLMNLNPIVIGQEKRCLVKIESNKQRSKRS